MSAMRFRVELEKLLALMVRILVDAPEEVEIYLDEAQRPVTFYVRVNPSDFGKVIGKQGRNAKSIRTLIACCAMRFHNHVHVDIGKTSEG